MSLGHVAVHTWP